MYQGCVCIVTLLGGFLSKLKNSGISLPFLTSPTQVFGLLSSDFENVDFFQWDVPALRLGLDMRESYPVFPGLNAFFDAMAHEAETVVRAGAPDGPLERRRHAFMRYHGQGHEIEIPLPDRALGAADIADLRAAFEAEYSRQFSRAVPGMAIEIMNWAIVVASKPPASAPYPATAKETRAQPAGHRTILCDVTGGWREAAVHDRQALRPGDQIAGPALIIEPQTTTLVSADFEARVDGGGNIWLTRERAREH